MSYVVITLSEEAQGVIRDAKTLAPRILKRCARVHDVENKLTAGWIVQHRMGRRGPDTLGVISGNLRRSVRPSKAVIVGNVIYSSIGSNIRYMGAHEFGFRGTVTVKSHTRRFARFEGQAISLADAKLLQGRSRKVNPKLRRGQSTVRSHSRRLDIPARAPIATGVRTRSAEYGRALSDGIMAEWLNSYVGGSNA